jgi:hypothetical protein
VKLRQFLLPHFKGKQFQEKHKTIWDGVPLKRDKKVAISLVAQYGMIEPIDSTFDPCLKWLEWA